MSDEFNESLSAAMDGEVSSFELRRMLARIEDGQSTKKSGPSLDKWQRYHLAQNVMHGIKIDQETVSVDLVSTLRTALKDEELQSDHVALKSDVINTSHNAWWKPLASVAMAASVTAVVILGGQQFMQDEDTTLRQAYTIPSMQTSKDFVRAQYSSNYPSRRSAAVEGGEPEVIRLSQGLNRYIDQHQHLLSSSQPAWQTKWLPEGFSKVRHEVMPHAEVMLFSDGKHSVSISVEPLGRQSVPAGVVQSNNIVAVGRVKEKGFITVVGDVPLMIADRIAESVKSVR
ncbi:MucB/RseB C-terminal domain-containing protein [Neptunomonas sp.]|uniref:MucB/RseB C-terminal domain-containing protein n=1 Tax=Neptunomonas sp. TaxID=1971898 RepID=UPI0025F79CA0|nr:MucB/RseB C-terminal domain-containing protein [Neptunomonas sp.]